MLVFRAVSLELLLEFMQAFLVLYKPSLELLLLLLQGCDLRLKVQPAAAALTLLFHPCAGAAGYIPEAAA